MRRPPPGLRPVRYTYAPPSVEKFLGALPVVAEFCRRLDLDGIVDRACPVREGAQVTHGQVIEALVANRLSSPRPLLRVEDWAREWAVEEVLGIDPAALNDDRIGRALDAMAPQLDLIIGSVGARAIAVFGVDVACLHWDMTSISVYGVYDDPEAGSRRRAGASPRIAGLISSRSRPAWRSAVTVACRCGIAPMTVARGEVAQVVGAMTALKDLAGQRKLLLVGDSKLVSRGNVQAMNTARVAFIAPAGKSYLPAEHLRVLDPSAATPVDYIAERDHGCSRDSGAATGSWRVASPSRPSARPMPILQCGACSCGPLRGPRPPPQARPRSWTVRERTWIACSAALAARTTGPLTRSPPGCRPSPTAARSPACFAPRQEPTRPPASRPLRGRSTQAALDAEAATDGWYGLGC